MKKGFVTPTISSVNKSTQDPASLRDKIQKLSSAVKELKNNAIQEDSYLENLQQSNMKNYNTLNNQLIVLKKVQNLLLYIIFESFNSLSDILLNEITNMGNQFGSAVSNLTQKIDSLEEQVAKSNQISNQINMNYSEVEEELQLLIKQNKDREYQMEQIVSNTSKVQVLFEKDRYEMQQNQTFRDDQKLQMEKFKIVIQNNQNQIDLINKDRNNFVGQISELKTKIQSLSGNQVDKIYFYIKQNQNEKNFQDFQEQLKLNNLEINTKLNEIRTSTFTQKDIYKNEQSQTLRELSSVIKTIEEKLRQQDDSIDQCQRQIRSKFNDVDSSLSKQAQVINFENIIFLRNFSRIFKNLLKYIKNLLLKLSLILIKL